MAGTPQAFRQRLGQPDVFVVATELVTSRGIVTAASARALIEKARALAEDPRIDVLSITDNPGGHAMLAPDTLGTDLLTRGAQVIIHLSCKDWNRAALESRGWKLASEGFHNVLALSGDYPAPSGYRGTAAPVFDLDSVGLLKLYDEMNQGLPDTRHPGERLEQTNFFLGCVVTNHKRLEREVVPQYLKLRKKTQAGARFVINQIGWNARKDDELLRYIKRAGLGLRALANVFLLSPASARAFHAGRIPGVVVTDELLALAERHGSSEDRGHAFFVDLAARQMATARRLGFDGAYLGGQASAETFGEVIERSEQYAEAEIRELTSQLHHGRPGEFYMFAPDPDTGLASDQLDPEYVSSTERRRTDLPVPASYRVSRQAHRLLFDPEAPLFGPARKLYEKIERAPRLAGRGAHLLEQMAKVPMFSCEDCGDCSLPDIAYVCPESMCAKNQRNGPCGGTRDGRCEVYETECIWSAAYERLKAYGEADTMLETPVVIKDNALQGTSAWANNFLDRDHNGKRRREDRGEPEAGR